MTTRTSQRFIDEIRNDLNDLTPRVSALEAAIINVRAYGALGDGVTNDTEAIQTALNVAKAAGGGTVYFPKGTYANIRSLLLENANNIRLIGEAGAILKGPGLAAPAWDKFIRFNYCNDITIQNLAFDAYKCDRFGGVEFYDCQRVWIDKCHAYNSQVTANADNKDRRSFYFFTNSATLDSDNEDIWITNCVIEDLQLEVHCSKNVHIHNNICRRGPITGGILLISATTDGGTVEDIWVTDNYVEDADGAGIYVTMEGEHDNTTFRRIHIKDNTIIMGLTPNANNSVQESIRGIQLGTVNNSDATTGNILHDVEITGNVIRVTADAEDLTCQEIIFANNSITANWNCSRFNVSNNIVYGNGTGQGISLRRVTNSKITNNQIVNTSTGVHVSVLSGVSIHGNTTNSSLVGLEVDLDASAGLNNVRDNVVTGSPTTRYNVYGTLAAGDYIELERLVFSAAYGNAGVAIGAGSAFHQDITVTNAAMGDVVSAAMSSINTSGIQVTANVISANTVRVSITNQSGSSRTFGAGTIRGIVTRIYQP